MMTSVALVIGIPFVSAAVLVLGRDLGGRQCPGLFATFLAGCRCYSPTRRASIFYLVGFTTSVFSASYIGHEIETGKLTPLYVRFYHAMFLGMMGAMNVLTANNIGLCGLAQMRL
jgi:hypothetical protein